LTSILTYLFASRGARGNPRSLLRLRIVAVILIRHRGRARLPAPCRYGFIEQAACRALLLATAMIIFRPTVTTFEP
jgi:hypothetical protein